MLRLVWFANIFVGICACCAKRLLPTFHCSSGSIFINFQERANLTMPGRVSLKVPATDIDSKVTIDCAIPPRCLLLTDCHWITTWRSSAFKGVPHKHTLTILSVARNILQGSKMITELAYELNKQIFGSFTWTSSLDTFDIVCWTSPSSLACLLNRTVSHLIVSILILVVSLFTQSTSHCFSLKQSKANLVTFCRYQVLGF